MSRNSITGDKIASKIGTKEQQEAYADSWERVFGVGKKLTKEEETSRLEESKGMRMAGKPLILNAHDKREAERKQADKEMLKKVGAKVMEDTFRHNSETNQFMELEKEQQVTSLQSKRQYPSLDAAYQQVEDDYRDD